jgi:hypothetical protein
MTTNTTISNQVTDLTIEARVERLQTFITEGRLLRNQWVGADAKGRETACLLAALSPEAGRLGESSACPAHVMPSWLAHLTPDLDDRGSEAAWPGMVQRYAALAAQWHKLDDAAWLRVQYRFLAATVREAVKHVATTETDVLAACNRVIELCEQVVETGQIDEEAFRAAAWAARAAAWAARAARAAAWAARAAAEAAWAARAARAAAEAAEAARAAAEAAWAARAAAWAAEAAAEAAEAAAEAAEAAEAAAEAAEAAEAAWDRLTVALFEAIELELVPVVGGEAAGS